MEWEDATSYARGQRGNIEPTAWQADLFGVRIWISSGHIYHKSNWIMNCAILGINEKKIGPVDALTLDEVKTEAVRNAVKTARAKAAKLEKFAHYATQGDS